MAAKTDKERQSIKQRSLHLIKSLDPEDDNRTTISKKISWILRRGAKVAGVKQDDKGFVLMSDLLKAEILAELDMDTLMQVIIDSNGRKLRYELKEGPNGQLVRAYDRDERRAKKESDGAAGPPDRPFTTEGNLRQDAAPFVPQVDSGSTPSAGTAATQQQQPGYYPMSPSSMGYGWPGFFNPMPFMNPWMAAGGFPPVQPGMFAGRIKSFNSEKGFGFIECAQTHQQYGRDVFLHKAHIGDLQVGAAVTFKCEVNKQGMPQAKEVSAWGAGGAAAAAALGGKGAGASKGKGKGKGKDKGKDKGKEKGKDDKGEGKGKKKRGKGGDKSDDKEDKKEEDKEGEKEKDSGEAADGATKETKDEKADEEK